MITIKGIELNEIDDLDYNLHKIRKELIDRTGFWSIYAKTIESFEKNNNGIKPGLIFKFTLIISLFPKLIGMQFSKSRRHAILEEAERELIGYYQKPISKVKRFRLKCQHEKQSYAHELKVIQEELDLHYRNIELPSLGSQTKNEVQNLITAFEEKKRKKEEKFRFYEECEQKLISIEEQIKVRKSIENSRIKLEEMEDAKVEKSRNKEIEKEFELYQYYGDLLDSISLNLKKIKQDKSGEIEEKELKEMISQIELRN